MASLTIVRIMRNVSYKSCRENQNRHIVFNNLFSLKSYPLWNIVENYGWARQAADDNILGANAVRVGRLNI